MIEDQELRKLFKAESAEHLARLDDGLLRLEKTPADQPLLEEVFRESHSLKGAARMLGLSGIETAAHGLETIFNAARKGEAPLTPEAIEGMNAALGDLRRHVREALVDERQPSEPSAAPPRGLPSGRIATSASSCRNGSADFSGHRGKRCRHPAWRHGCAAARAVGHTTLCASRHTSGIWRDVPHRDRAGGNAQAGRSAHPGGRAQRDPGAGAAPAGADG